MIVAAAPVSPDSCIHVFVALCDNLNQGIVPVPARIGNGQDPGNNLYWGCGYGVRTFFKRSDQWSLLKRYDPPDPAVLERCVFRHKASGTWLVADAYDGSRIRQCTNDFFRACSGADRDTIQVDSLSIVAGGNSQLLAYVGHNGLLDFELDTSYSPLDQQVRKAIMLCCSSRDWYGPYLAQTGAAPMVWTTSVMAPEAYSLEAAIARWLEGDDGRGMRMAAAAAYDKYQHCGIRAAQRLFDHWE